MGCGSSSFSALFALLRLFQGAFGFLHARCHGDALAREAAFFSGSRFGFACGGFGSGAACRACAPRFFQGFAGWLRESEARQRQQEKRESGARLSQAGNVPSWPQAASGQAKRASSARYLQADHP